MSTNSDQVQVQLAAFLLSIERQRAAEMERSAQAAGALVAYLQKQNNLLEEQIALLEHRAWLLDQCVESSNTLQDCGERDVNRAF